MILYFSGTGHSRKVALSLSAKLGEKAFFMPHTNPETIQFEGRSLGFVVPVYSWGIPPFAINYLERLSERFVTNVVSKQVPVWCVLTYGDEAGLALNMLSDCFQKRGVEVNAAWGVKTPNVYLLLPGFKTDSKEVEQQKISDMRNDVEKIAGKISTQQWETQLVKGPLAWLKTRLVYPLFVKWGVNASKWHTDTSKCIGCGKCEAICPASNIAMIDSPATSHRVPKWGRNCLSCCGCYHVCPTRAIDYGRTTEGKDQADISYKL